MQFPPPSPSRRSFDKRARHTRTLNALPREWDRGRGGGALRFANFHGGGIVVAESGLGPIRVGGIVSRTIRAYLSATRYIRRYPNFTLRRDTVFLKKSEILDTNFPSPSPRTVSGITRECAPRRADSAAFENRLQIVGVSFRYFSHYRHLHG